LSSPVSWSWVASPESSRNSPLARSPSSLTSMPLSTITPATSTSMFGSIGSGLIEAATYS
jgi:hypothetical protein